jgi:hypothetical protein
VVKTCEFVVAATAIAEGAVAGLPRVPSVGVRSPMSPSLPAAATTVRPNRIAFSTATASRSHGNPGDRPHSSPEASGSVRAGPPSDRIAISMPSLTASSSAVMMASVVAKSFTPGEPNTL